MTAMTRNLAHRLADVIDIKDAEVAVDVGGAGGNLVQTLMRRHPGLTGKVLDLPRVGADADASAEKLGVRDRFTFVGGDFFDKVPSGDEVGKPGLEPLMDMNMRVQLTGRERSADEFETVFNRAGLRLVSVTPSASLLSVLEAVPA
ncbi:hypothetical protein FGK60_36755 [Streptomyces sp. DASNCL29]|nr:hypothetical protein FGK60_36755 [Streptomyces sp. DASNCL29]